MKNLTAVIGTLIVLISAYSASARSIMPLNYVLSANIESMNIDQDSYLKNMTIYGGQIKVKQISREITLELNHAPECKPGFACIEVLLVHSITLPITHQFTDRCGSTTYVAERDLLPVDGAHEVLTVRDNTFNKCPHFIALAETEVVYKSSHYDRINGGMISTRSTFEADKLEGRVLPTADLPKVLPALQ